MEEAQRRSGATNFKVTWTRSVRPCIFGASVLRNFTKSLTEIVAHSCRNGNPIQIWLRGPNMWHRLEKRLWCTRISGESIMNSELLVLVNMYDELRMYLLACSDGWEGVNWFCDVLVKYGDWTKKQVPFFCTLSLYRYHIRSDKVALWSRTSLLLYFFNKQSFIDLEEFYRTR
jgi:hypothetical protein